MKRIPWTGWSGMLVVLLAVTPVALAHPGHDGAASGVAGLLHPWAGLDHLLAMLASGLLAVRVGSRRGLWMVPLSFVGLMALGGVSAYLGMPLPAAEWAIAASVIVLGLVVAAAPSIPVGVGAGLVGAFAFFHGHAHVVELDNNSVSPYFAGMLLSTLLLHGVAIVAGMGATKAKQAPLVRVAGAAIAVCFAVVVFVGL